jgi:hypothetical protein
MEVAANSCSYDFEETYDGLGDQLDETLDEFNDETFGTSGADVGSVIFLELLIWQCSGRDFDFYGKTAKIADVMEEEQMTYARSHLTHQPPPTQAARQAEIQHQQQQKNIVRQQIQKQSVPSARNVSLALHVNDSLETTCSKSCDLG